MAKTPKNTMEQMGKEVDLSQVLSLLTSMKEENSKINELLHKTVQEFSITLRKYHTFAASNPPAAYRLWFGVSSSADHTRARSDPG